MSSFQCSMKVPLWHCFAKHVLEADIYQTENHVELTPQHDKQIQMRAHCYFYIPGHCILVHGFFFLIHSMYLNTLINHNNVSTNWIKLTERDPIWSQPSREKKLSWLENAFTREKENRKKKYCHLKNATTRTHMNWVRERKKEELT